MSVQIYPETPGNWVLRADLSRDAERSQEGKYYIPFFDIGLDFQAQFFAVSIEVKCASSNWRNGGYLAQQFDLAGDSNTKANYHTTNLLINSITLVEIPVISVTPYRLIYHPPTWFFDVRIRLWEYVGVIQDEDSSDNFDDELLKFFIDNLLPLIIQALLPEINSLFLSIIVNLLLPAIGDMLPGSPPPPALPGSETSSFYLDNDFV